MIESQRKKVWRPKTRTGCLTCRVRRIKCDEAKPHCQRCTSTGRKCDGYQTPENQKRKSKSESPPTTSLTTINPRLLTGTPLEREAFYFFETQTVPQFAGFYGSHHYFHGILQASLFQPEIRHALNALGAMHNRYIAGNSSPGVPDNPNDPGLRFAIAQCNQSIQLLMSNQHTPSAHSKETTLVLSLIYFSLACLQGLQAQSFTHLRAGLEILAEKQKTGDRTDSSTPSYPVSNASFRTAFVGLDSMARSMIPDSALDHWTALIPIHTSTSTSPTYFSTLDEAADWLENTYNSLLSFTQLFLRLPASPSARQIAESRHSTFTRIFASAGTALEDLVAREQSAFTPAQRTSVSMLRLLHSTATATLSILSHTHESPTTTTTTHSELIYDALTPNFTLIISSASLVLAEPNLPSLLPSITHLLHTPSFFHPDTMIPVLHATQRSHGIPLRKPSYSPRYGIIPPLYLVAARCRDPVIRRQAIALLLHWPRREGLWDGVIAGRIALELVALEEGERGVKVAADVPEEARVKGVKIEFRQGREMVFWIRRGGEGEGVGVGRVVRW